MMTKSDIVNSVQKLIMNFANKLPQKVGSSHQSPRRWRHSFYWWDSPWQSFTASHLLGYLQINPSQQWIFFFFIMSNWGCETPFVEAFLDPALKISHVGWQISWQSETNINVQYVSQPRHHPPHPALLVFTKNYCVHTIDIIVWHHWQHVFTTDELCQTRQKSNWIVGEINN